MARSDQVLETSPMELEINDDDKESSDFIINL